MKTTSTKSIMLNLALSLGLLTAGTGAFAQSLPVLPSPNHESDHTALINGVVTVNGSAQQVAGVVARLSRVIPGSPETLVPVSYAMSDANGAFTLTGQPGVTYRISYEFPTAGFTAPQGNPSDSFTAADGVNAAPNGGIELFRNLNTITNCNVTARQATDWTTTIQVAKAEQINPSAILNSVTVFGSTLAAHPMIEVIATTASNVRALRVGAAIDLDGPSYFQSLEAVKNFAGAPTAQNIVLNADQTLTYYDISSAGTSNQALSSVPVEYTGSGNVTFNANAYGSKTITTTGGNTSSMEQTFASAGVCLTYTYNIDPLPVTLTSFSATKSAENVKSTKLEWKTSAETQSDRFEIQRSNDGKAWEQIGTVLAKGESSIITHYEFADENPFAGENLYRLKMVDADGTFALSSVRNVRFEMTSQVVLHPNPVRDMLTVKSNTPDHVAEVTIYNLTGIPLFSKRVNNGDNKIDMSRLSPGLYMVKTISDNGSYHTQKVIVTK
ncbi:T9SS type A sorting domain-containing protein [Dyadobacter sp.]|uniref:T9SS type A sorting domain-containing protein n=1 Tax=Dyadobacter sp. TaxID=1914288 RepID=UPI003F7161D1